MPARPAFRVAVLVGGALLLGACGGGDGEQPTTSAGATATPSPPSPTAPVEGIDPLAGASTNPVTVEATNERTALLRDVRAARHEGYDRIVFEFTNTLPGYDVRYVERPVHQDGSGNVVVVKGDFVLQARMENALDADLTKPSAPMTYKGPLRFSPGTPEVVELVRTGGFEGVLTWVAGVQDRVDFRVSTLQAPPRLVVDLRNH